MKFTLKPPGFERPELFQRLAIVVGLGSVGDWLGLFALTAYVADIADRPEFAVGTVLLFRVIPGILLGPFAGVLVDRFDRRRLLAWTDCSRGLLALGIPFTKELWLIFAINSALEVLSLLTKPAVTATVPKIVGRGPNLIKANQILAISTYAMMPVGGALVALLTIPAAWLAGVNGLSWLGEDPVRLPMLLDAATFFVSAAVFARFPRDVMQRGVKTEETRVRKDLVEGLRYAWTHRSVRATLFGAWIAFIGGSATAGLGPVYAAQVVGGGSSEAQTLWGSLIVAAGLGLVSGMVFAGRLDRMMKRIPVFPLGLLVAGAATAGIAAKMTPITVLLAAVISGAGIGVAWVSAVSTLQDRVAEHVQGRVFATLFTGTQVSLFLGLAGWPLIAGSIDALMDPVDPIGARLALLGGGCVLVIGGIIALTAPAFEPEAASDSPAG